MQTSIRQAGGGTTSLAATIPAEIIKKYALKLGDKLNWDLWPESRAVVVTFRRKRK